MVTRQIFLLKLSYLPNFCPILKIRITLDHFHLTERKKKTLFVIDFHLAVPFGSEESSWCTCRQIKGRQRGEF